MTGLDVLLAVAGLTVTVLVVAGMILITPGGAVDAFDDVADPQLISRGVAGSTGRY